MDIDIKKLLKKMIKYDLQSGIIISVIIILISSFINAGVYLVGLNVALINFLVSGYIIFKYLGKNKKQYIIIISYFVRMIFILITIVPFLKNTNHIIYYLIGFISHYIILIVSNIKNRKGSV